MRAVRALLATLVLITAVCGPALVVPVRAHAAEPEALVSITLDSFVPALPKRDGTITITGEVKNTSKRRLERPRAYFWRNQAPITDREGFDAALESASNEPLGARVIQDGAIANLFVDAKPYLEAGGKADFSLTAKVSDLDLSPTSGVYLMGVHVLQNDAPVAIGRSRVFVPILAKAPRNSLQLTSVVALSSRPSLLRPASSTDKATFADDHLAKEIRSGGRLDTLLKAAAESNVSFAVDPALVEELQAMKGGYQILNGAKDGPGRSDAERWLGTFTRVLGTQDGYRLLYGSLDVAALSHAGRADVIQSSEAAAKTVSLTASLPLLIWPGGGAADEQTLVDAATAKPAAVLLSDSSTRATEPLLRSAAGPAVVNYTSSAYGGGPGPDPSDDPVHLQQRLLADSWIQASTEPAGTTLGHVRLISTPTQATSDDEAVKAPWFRPSTLSQLLRSTPAPWDGALRYSDSNREKELSAAQLNELDALSKTWSTWQDLLVDRTAAVASADAAIARASSVKLRGAEESYAAFVAPQLSDLGHKLDAIVISRNRRVLTPKSGASFPITIRNTLPASDNPDNPNLNAVRVKLIFTSTNSQRLTVQPIELTDPILAGDNIQKGALVEAKTNGTVRVIAQLYTSSGAPVGEPVTIDVQATEAGTVGWLIALGAGIVLIGTTALRIRQVTRERTRAAAQADSEAVADHPNGSLDATRSAPAVDTTSPDQSESIDV